MGKLTNEDMFVAQVLSVAPKVYASVLTTEQSIIKSKGEAVTLEKLVKAMCCQFRIENKLDHDRNEMVSKDEDEKKKQVQSCPDQCNCW